MEWFVVGAVCAVIVCWWGWTKWKEAKKAAKANDEYDAGY